MLWGVFWVFLLDVKLTIKRASQHTASISLESYLILSMVLELVVSSSPTATLNV